MPPDGPPRFAACARRDRRSSAAPRLSDLRAVRTLLLGGIRSGKSRCAEEIMARDSSVRYVATGAAADTDPSWAQRLAAHRERRPVSWRTLETADVAGVLRAEPGTATLVDDLGGWLTATLDRQGWDGGSVTSDVDDLVRAVDEFTGPLTLVSPEVGLTVVA